MTPEQIARDLGRAGSLMSENFLDGGAEAPGSHCTFCSGWAQNRAVSCLHPGALRTSVLWGFAGGPTYLGCLPTLPMSCGCVAWPVPPCLSTLLGPRTQAVSVALADTSASHAVLPPCDPRWSVHMTPHYRGETFQIGRVVVRGQGWPLSPGLSTLHLMLFIQPLL